ncbi:hypothetical protein [Deinococcus sp.]|uniref:hypothetical protein n=1 Tax=Deinococcus sp. TaxID=47478 RepID=UPI0025E28610|nr:hypothetical protein [Deinococcus sp.]
MRRLPLLRLPLLRLPLLRLPLLRLPLLLCAALALLSGCRYNFIPVIPAEVSLELPLRLTNATLQRQGGELLVRAKVEGPVSKGYLSVVWYSGDAELGRDSRYLDGAGRSAEFRLMAPDKADYKALLLYQGVLLRQLDLREVDSLK